MKKLFYLFLTGTLLLLPFTSCNDDDDKITIPDGMVSNLSFTDTDYEKDKIGGQLTWTLPSSEQHITGYVIYLSSSATDKGGSIDEVKAGVSSYTIIDGTEYKPYIHIVAKNSTGESEQKATLNIRDNTTPVVEELTFDDLDYAYNLIAGELTWKAPQIKDGSTITGYVVYSSDNSAEKGKVLDTIKANETSYTIKEGTAYIPYLQVSIILDGEIADDFAVLAVVDSYRNRSYYVLNTGNYDGNNASLGFYNAKTDSYDADLFKTSNGQGLGDSAQEMLIYGSKIYITVYGSNTLVVTDLDGKLLQEVKNEDVEPWNPRSLASYDGKVFVSYYKGHSVGVIDTTAFQIEKIIEVGRYPEQMVVANKKLYVANSGGLDYSNPEIGYGNTVSVIDLATLEKTKDIEVVINPTLLTANSQGDVYVISMGNYKDVPNTLQVIDRDTDLARTIGNATLMSLANDQLYTVFAPYYTPEDLAFNKFDALTGTISERDFIKGVSLKNPNSIDVDPATGRIYIADYAYNATSDLYIFDSNGKYEEKFDTNGYSTKGVWFK